MKSVLFGTILSFLLIAACNKDENDSLVGRAHIKFNADPAFFEHDLFEVKYTPATYAYYDTTSPGIRRVTVTTVTGKGGADDHKAEVFLQIPSHLNSNNGPITIDLSQPFSSPVYGAFYMGIPGFNFYKSKSGIMTITKLNDLEIEGFFECLAEVQFSADEDITVTNGTFAGKLRSIP